MARTPRPKRRRMSVFSALALLLAFALTATVGGVLAAGLAMPAVAVASRTTDMVVEAFEDIPTELEQRPLSEKSVMLANDGSTVLAEFWAENRVVVPLDRVSVDMQNAVIATEDRRFYEHGGIDPAGMLRAAVRNVTNPSRTEGASTLTQQYVKNVLIETAVRAGDYAGVEAAREAQGAEGYARKLHEAKLAIALEKEMTKDQILEAYVNIAQFGVSTYGVEAAALRFFSVHAADLTYLQAATIAGVTQSPSAYDPVRHPEESQGRRDRVLRLMHEEGYITSAQLSEGLGTPLSDTLSVSEPKVGCMAAGDAVRGSGFFCDYVTKVIRNDPAFGETEDDRVELLYRGGLTITTTLDPREQAFADEDVRTGVPVDDPSGVASSIVTVEPGTGRITSMAQNRVYNNTEDHGERETAVNFNTDFEYGGGSGFPPGSTFKPFTLTEWFKEGHNLSEVVDGTRFSYRFSEFNAPCTSLNGSTEYRFSNAEGPRSGGRMTAQQATSGSVNSGYMAMASRLNLCGIIDTATSLGIHRAGGSSGDGPFQVLPANVLGSDSVAPLTMAAAFASFASGGVYCEPVAILSVTDADGQSLPVPEAGCSQVLDANIANAVNHALSGVWAGTAATSAPPFTAAGKTGTTSRNEHTWFVGYTPVRATAVWVGFSEGMHPMQRVTVDGQYFRNVYGSSIAVPTWKRFMQRTLDGVAVPGFGAAAAEQIVGNEQAIPSVVGQNLSTAQATLSAAGFASQVGGTVNSSAPAGQVVSQQPTGNALPGATVTLTVSSGS